MQAYRVFKLYGTIQGFLSKHYSFVDVFDFERENSKTNIGQHSVFEILIVLL